MTKKYVSKNCANKKPDRPWTRKQSDITDIEYPSNKDVTPSKIWSNTKTHTILNYL